MAIAIFLIFLVTALVVNQPWDDKKTVPDDIKLIQDTILNMVESNEDLRYSLVSKDETEVDPTEALARITSSLNLADLIPNTMNSALQLCWDVSCPLGETERETLFGHDTDYTEKTIYADSLIIQEKNYLDESQIAVLRLFLWRKIE